MVLGSEMLISLKRGLEVWWTRTMSADEQSDGVGFLLFLVGVRVIQHMFAFGAESVGAVDSNSAVEQRREWSEPGWRCRAMIA